MPRPNRRQMLATLGSALTVTLAGCGGDGAGDDGGDGDGAGGSPTPAGGMDTPAETEVQAESTETGAVRVAHFSPDAPNVDVYVDGEQVLSDVPFRAVSDYLEVPTGSRTVQITAAGDMSTVAFEGDIQVGSGDYTVAAIGELASEDTEFRPLVLEDDTSDPGADTARVRAVHASPDAPAVDITAGETVLFDGVAFGGSGAVEVPAGDYTLEIRGDTMDNDGDVVAEFDVSLNGSTVYTAFAGGYLTTDDESTDVGFDLTVVEDASY